MTTYISIYALISLAVGLMGIILDPKSFSNSLSYRLEWLWLVLTAPAFILFLIGWLICFVPPICIKNGMFPSVKINKR